MDDSSPPARGGERKERHHKSSIHKHKGQCLSKSMVKLGEQRALSLKKHGEN
jgi:hypothetical protein